MFGAVMGHYTLHALICLWGYYICATVTQPADSAKDPEIVIPQVVSPSGSFLSHHLPRHWSRQATQHDPVHYLVHIAGEPHHLELQPNPGLLAPGARLEVHAEDGIHFRKLRDLQCHFTGKVKGVEGSRVALSTCKGLSGYIRTPRGHFDIEPQDELTDARHPHLVYQRRPDHLEPGMCCHTHGTGSFSHIISKREEEIHQTKRIASSVKNMYTTKVKPDLYLELLLVLDKGFTDHHTEMDTEHYIMTVMNMAHDLFAQESLGRPVYLSIVRIIRLEAEDNEINLSLMKNPAKTLGNFLDWQDVMNPGNDTHPNHHDLAILITRADIYAGNGNRNFLGIAHLGSACNRRIQGVICQDIGLSLGYIISHEIGHATGLGKCLMDKPADHPFEYTDQLPGQIYDANWQCRNWFGNQAETCNTAPRCDTILCRLPDVGCVDIHYPPADGTSCGDDKWCYHGQCLQQGMRPTAKDGGWGPWSEWSQCSKTCGSGVAYSERRCDCPQPSNGGKFCRGRKIKYRICNAEPCPAGSIKFRDSQCAKYNTWIYPDDGKTHSWLSTEYFTDDPCALYCINEEGTITQLGERALDGTSCYRGIRDVCIAGQCVKVPCDLEMDSGAVEDVCGICHGDGTTCTLKEGQKFFPQSSLDSSNNKSYDEIYKFIDVPAGSQNIRIEETEPTTSRIEVRDGEGEAIYVEGDAFGLFEVPGSRAWLGMVRFNQELLHIPGPISEPLSIWVQPNQNVTYKYALSLKTEKRQGAYHWDFVDWTPCSSQCGTGTAVSIPKCVEQSSGMVDDEFCVEEKPQRQVRTCYNIPCKPRWMLSDWSKCNNKRTGEPTQTRMVRCVRPIGGEISDLIVVASSLCPQPKPIDMKDCDNSAKNNCDEKERRKRKVFHRPNRITHRSNSMFGTHMSTYMKEKYKKLQRNNRRRRWKNFLRRKRAKSEELPCNTDQEDEQFLDDEEDWVKRLSIEKGKIQLDKIPPLLQKLTIKNEVQDNIQSITSKTFLGEDFYKKMEKLRKTFKDDQI